MLALGLGFGARKRSSFGPQLLTNTDFSAWTGDNPDDWTVNNESAPDYEVTEHANGARIVAVGTANVLTLRYASAMISGRDYRLEITISNWVSGTVRTNASGSGTEIPGSGANGTHVYDFTSGVSNFDIYRSVTNQPTDYVISAISLREVL